MKEYKIHGLSCANCARELQEKIKKIDFGSETALSYNSSKLTLDERIDLSHVKKILASDGAVLVLETDRDMDGHSHKHVHSHDKNRKMVKILLLSIIFFFLGMILDQWKMNASVLFYVLTMAISGYTTFFKGLKNLVRFKFTIDTLMTIALLGAVAIGQWREASVVAILFGLNEWLEGLGMEKARHSMAALLNVAPKKAVIIQEGVESNVPVSDVKKGDLVLVKSGEQIPSDGLVEEGNSSVNEAAITGEPLPVEKSPGEGVYGGSINNQGVMKIRITKAYEDSSLAKILHLVEEAQETKTPTELFINHFAKYYTPFVLFAALLVIFVPPLFLGGSWGKWVYQGLAVLIVGCPCALILSSPIAIVSGIARNARNGILIKGGVFLELLGKVKTIAFDKTGTLTLGKPRVVTEIAYDRERLYMAAASIERNSGHPLAKAVFDHTKHDSAIQEPEHVETVAGSGVLAVIDGENYYIGNEKNLSHLTFSQEVQTDLSTLKEQGYTIVMAADDHEVLGIFALADEIREEAAAVIRKLKALGIRNTIMLTGDHVKTAERAAVLTGVSDYHGGLLPDQKMKKIKELRKMGPAAMIGDGINDAPALAAADLGIAMGKGTDSAIETADVVLMQDHLGKLPEAVAIAKRVNTVIRFNIGIALGLKLIALLLTIPGLLTLWIAILSDMGATILVTLISLTVLLERKRNPQGI